MTRCIVCCSDFPKDGECKECLKNVPRSIPILKEHSHDVGVSNIVGNIWLSKNDEKKIVEVGVRLAPGYIKNKEGDPEILEFVLVPNIFPVLKKIEYFEDVDGGKCVRK